MGIINLLNVDGKNNPSDVLTKFLPYSKLQPLIQLITTTANSLFYAIE
jgi:hypothetical protein